MTDANERNYGYAVRADILDNVLGTKTCGDPIPFVTEWARGGYPPLIFLESETGL